MKLVRMKANVKEMKSAQNHLYKMKRNVIVGIVGINITLYAINMINNVIAGLQMIFVFAHQIVHQKHDICSYAH